MKILILIFVSSFFLFSTAHGKPETGYKTMEVTASEVSCKNAKYGVELTIKYFGESNKECFSSAQIVRLEQDYPYRMHDQWDKNTGRLLTYQNCPQNSGGVDIGKEQTFTFNIKNPKQFDSREREDGGDAKILVGDFEVKMRWSKEQLPNRITYKYWCYGKDGKKRAAHERDGFAYEPRSFY